MTHKLDSEKIKDGLTIVSGVLKEMYSHWFRDLIFFLAITCEVFASQYILPHKHSASFDLENSVILLGFSIFWYSACIAYGFWLNTAIGLSFAILKIDLSISTMYLPISLIFSGLCLFGATFFILILSFFGLTFHLHLLSLLLACLFLPLVLRIYRRKITRLLFPRTK